jgi:hypothetical protein
MVNDDQQGGGGSSHDRRVQRRHHDAPQPIPAENEKKAEPLPGFRQSRIKDAESKRRLNDLLGPMGIALGLASWGWTVIAPESSRVLGSVLLLLAAISFLAGVVRTWHLRKFLATVVTIVVITCFVAFDWYIVIKPQRGKPFQALLVEGYHLTNECEIVPARTEMPAWMRDQSTEWQARTQALIFDKLKPEDIQLWKGATIIGSVKDVRLNAYQCLWLANKVGALETIIAGEYDPSLKHRDYNGPTYWFNVSNGQADISEALKKGRTANIYFYGGDDRGNGMVNIKASGIPANSAVDFSAK